MTHPELIETLRQAQRFGFFGPGPIEAAAEHAMAFVAAIGPLPVGSRIVDLGSGGGLPGLVVADAYPDASLLFVDRREKRTDFLERAVSRLGWRHVEVQCIDVRALIEQVDAGDRGLYDVVTARGFGPPVTTLRMAVRLIGTEGRIVISEPPQGDRWPADLLAELDLVATQIGAVRVFERST